MAGSGLDRTVVDRIFHRCEGWLAGLQMAFIAAEKYGGGSLFPRVKEHIIDYFMEEVFSCQPGHIRNFLLETSVLSRLNPSLCNAVTERSDSAEILDQLRAANLFLVELDGNSFWHRYHQIFAEALYARLAAEEPDRIELLHARAAQWFKRNKMPAEAIHHAIAGRQWKSAVELVSKYAAIAILRGDFPTALRWIRALPENRVTENPFLCISYAWALFLTNLSKFTSIPYSTIEYLLGEAEKFLPGLKQAQGEQGPEYQAVTGYVDALRVHLAYCRNEPRQQVLSRGRQILEKFSSDNVLVRTNIFFTLALTYLDTGELDSCSSCLEEARSAAFIGGYCFQVIIADSFRAYLARMRGRLRTSEMIRKKGLQSVKQAFVDTNRISPEMLGYYDLHRAYFLFERNRLDQAAAAAGSAMESIRLLGETYTRVFGYEVMFYINLFRGSDSDLVLFPLEKLENLYVYCTMARPFAGALRIRYLLARFPESREAVDRAFALADQYGISLWEDLDSEQKPHPVPFEKRMRRVKQLNLIRLFMEDIVTGLRRRCQMTRKEIRQNIELLLEGIRHDGFGDMEIEALILLALALDAEGRQTEAADTLKQAICLADPEGYLRIFVNEGTRLATVLEKCIKSGICVDYALKILNIIRTEAGSDASDIQDPAFPADDKPLSRQEQTVLRLLSSGLTNQEIAENLCIAVTTVKTHNYNIFKKLKVTSRMAAAEKAKQMGLGK
ncbi:MAG: LuxR C-terminal-related transcriptional regulator [Desulfosalsimonas sp.]